MNKSLSSFIEDRIAWELAHNEYDINISNKFQAIVNAFENLEKAEYNVI